MSCQSNVSFRLFIYVGVISANIFSLYAVHVYGPPTGTNYNIANVQAQ